MLILMGVALPLAATGMALDCSGMGVGDTAGEEMQREIDRGVEQSGSSSGS